MIAPGLNILVAFPPNIPSTSSIDWRRVNYNLMSGTSMACPHVARAAALLLAIHPDWSPAAIRSTLMTIARTTDNEGNPIAKYDEMHSAITLEVRVGHIILQLAVDPGLVYDVNVSDYINFMCSLKYIADQVRLFVEATDPCVGNNVGSPADLNYPSKSVVLTESTIIQELKRTLTNVIISIDPGRLTFTNVMEKYSFMVNVVKIMGSGRYIDETVSGYVA
ncbi:hypothetical protein LguiA_013889 [Lonicera macranthoides]